MSKRITYNNAIIVKCWVWVIYLYSSYTRQQLTLSDPLLYILRGTSPGRNEWTALLLVLPRLAASRDLCTTYLTFLIIASTCCIVNRIEFQIGVYQIFEELSTSRFHWALNKPTFCQSTQFLHRCHTSKNNRIPQSCHRIESINTLRLDLVKELQFYPQYFNF